MPFEDKENLTDLQTFSTEVWFNDNVSLYGKIFGDFTLSDPVTLENTGTVQQLFERLNVSSTALSGTIDLDVLSGTLFYYTTNASADWSFNVRGSLSTSLNSILPTNKSVILTILSTQGSSSYYASTFKIDNTTVVPKWQNGSTPSSGYANSINAYTYSILKTADSTFTVLASLTKFS
jgi:hypothetical protein